MKPLPGHFPSEVEVRGRWYGLDDFETLNARDYLCPVCGASDRERLIALYIRERTRDLKGKASLLHFAPETALAMYLKDTGVFSYRSCDLFMVDADDRMDITNMSGYGDDTIDCFICSHVLEHVHDDRKALSELYRILKPGGWGIVLTPVLSGLADTYEDPSITSAQDRERHFGQADHVRLYAKADYIARLSGAGFAVSCLGVDHFGADTLRQAAITARSVLYVVEKRRVVCTPPHLHVTKTYLPYVQKYQAYIREVFCGGWLTNYSRFVRELEGRLTDYLGVKHVIVVANGTLALQVAYRALGLSGEVVTTPFTFVATSSALVWEGLTPVFADIDPDTLNLDAAQIEASITDKTSAIVAVHVFGNPCAIGEIERIAQRHSLKVIYDASHAFGVDYDGRGIAGYGNVSTLSFHATKIFHTAEGGAVVTNDDDIASRVRRMINFGITGPETIEDLGINAKMSELHATLGLCILDDMQKITAARSKVFDRYERSLCATLRRQRHESQASRNYGYYPVIFQSEGLLLEVKESLNGLGIYPRRYFFPSLNTVPYLGHGQRVPVSEDIAKRILCLPIYCDLPEDVQDIIIDTINTALR
ncbi:MAG: DegT/DnrJ/EryC1/StrS family aminotransferase [Nitrospirae bacterium]|uniref:DegT/DnrJ/EryC1/StrS family aminotransferase n=1 Tax=Candidatus Magnetobacterium casense TaxID=1455061 RepID=UPI0009E0606E|nr:DegT/DnrJ/EryC1/StrS family aminotransferase [Candidatus Magnetobacterium casensis]MBF0338741.1 DegT/DnrJ/EryC1/StrS family aminotransferase [Nitrospirota bacterium]